MRSMSTLTRADLADAINRKVGLPRTESLALVESILNLMSNAIKFTDSGHVEVSTRCLASVSGVAKIEVSVTDTGIGIASDKIGGLFSDFLHTLLLTRRR